MDDNPLEKALKLTNGDRQEKYGHPRDSFRKVALMWSAILGVNVRVEQVPLCMMALKIARETHSHQDDNLVDIAGYVNTLHMVAEGE